MLPDSPYGITRGLNGPTTYLHSNVVTWSASLGVTWFRIQISLNLIWKVQSDPSSNWNWNQLDDAISQLQTAGFHIVFPLRGWPSWCLQTPSQQATKSSDHLADWWLADPTLAAQAATAIATRYNGVNNCVSVNASGVSTNYGKLTIHAIEVGNEEFNDKFIQSPTQPASGTGVTAFGIRNSPYTVYNGLSGLSANVQPTRDPWFWVQVAKTCYPAIKAANPNCLVGQASIFWKYYPNYVAFMDGLYAAGGKPYFDYSNWHIYTNSNDPLSLASSNAQGIPGFPDGWNVIQAAQQKWGDTGKPIWCTEFGWGVPSDVTAAIQSSNYTRVFDNARQSGVVDKLFLYTINDLTPASSAFDDKTLVYWGYNQAGAGTSYVFMPAYGAIQTYIGNNPTWGNNPPPNTNTLGVSPRAHFTINESGTTGGGTPNVMVITMENRAYSEITATSSTWTNVKGLMSTYANLTKFYAELHPSLPNYLAFMSGSTQGVTTDDTPANVGGPFAGKTFLDLLSSASPAIPWNSYFESIPSTGYTGADTGNYAQRHNPFVYFTTFLANSAEVNKMVGFTQAKMVSDLNASKPPNFIWFTPNTTDDGHTPNTDDTTPDTFIGNLVTAIQGTNWYKNNGTIIIVWDESHPETSNDLGIGDANPGGGQTGCVVISAFTKGYGSYNTPTNHYGILSSLCTLYGVSPLKNAAHTANGNINPLFTTGSGTTSHALYNHTRSKFSISGVGSTHTVGVSLRARFKISKSLEVDPLVKFSILDKPLLQALMIFPGRDGVQPMKGRDGIVNIKGRDGIFSFKGRNGKSISFKGRGANR